jgi:multidrug efflux system membrane fusion protein
MTADTPPATPLLRRRSTFIVLLLAAALLTWLLWPEAEKAGPPAGRPGWGGPVPVRLVEATREALAVELTALGTVTPLASVTVRSRVDGELIELAPEGKQVAAGDLIARIDSRPFEVALAEAEGQQQQNLALLRNAEANLKLYRGLFEQDSIARQQLDDQEALVRQYKGTLRVDQARVDNARLQLSFTRITAPISGRLGLRKVDPGNLIGSGDSEGLVVITQMDPIGVLFNLPEADLPAVLAALHSGRELAVEAWSRSGDQRLASGLLLTVDNQIDSTTGTVALKAQFGNGLRVLFPHQFVNVRLRVDTVENAVVLPSAAVQHGSMGPFVYAVNDEGDKPRVNVRRVDLGVRSGDRTAILRGLEVGERVVIEGLDRLRDNAEVVVVEESGQAAPQQARQAGPAPR